MSSNHLRWLLIVQCCVLAGSLGLAACGGDDDDTAGDDQSACADDDDAEAGDAGEPAVGPESGATCPSDNTLTYDNFGKKFMSDYCVRCHSSKLEKCADRNNAPLGHDFDTLPGILLVANHIDQMAAAGPDSTNKSMPKDGQKPSDADRKKLGAWLACEIDKINE